MCKGGKASQIHCATKARGQLCNAVHRIQQLVSVQHSPKYLHLSLEIVLLRSSFYSSVFLDLNIIDSGSRKQKYHAGSILISVMDYWQQLHIRTFFIVSLFSGLFFFFVLMLNYSKALMEASDSSRLGYHSITTLVLEICFFTTIEKYLVTQGKCIRELSLFELHLSKDNKT